MKFLGCKEIILNSIYTKRHWHIKNNIFSKKTNLTIRIGNNVNCSAQNIICSLSGIYFHPKIVRVKIRVDVVKNEILNNLLKIKTELHDLYIHIRFSHFFIHSSYSQPPLCFYEKIINNFKFNKIYIIAQDNENKIINELTYKYQNVIYKKNKLDEDIAYLVYAYNIVASISSFLIMSIKLNDNLKNLWEYDIYRLKEKFNHLHHHFFSFPIKFNIYTMMPSENYIKEMFHWENSESQVKLMLEEKCPYDFTITKPNL